MAINKQTWLIEQFYRRNAPHWNCPTCKFGILQMHDQSLVSKHNAHSKKLGRVYLNEFPDKGKKHLAGILLCSNADCQESVSFCGEVIAKMEYDDNVHQNYPVEYYRPLYFHPPLEIFPLSTNCPVKIKNQILKSFAHYFSDHSSAANAMRIALEIMLNEQKVKRTFINKNRKRGMYPLDQRIGFLSHKFPSLHPYLLAAKWIGNAGSHFGEITKDDLLDGYELIQHTIDELYDKKHRHKELSAKAKSINKRKKPESTKRKK